MKNKKGFTLIELIIVIAIIAVLAAVLIPTMTNAVNDANVVSTKNVLSTAIADYENALTEMIVKGLIFTDDEAKTKIAEYLGVDESALVDVPKAKGEFKIVFGTDSHISSASFWLKNITYTYKVNEKIWIES